MSDVKQVKVDNWGIYFLQRLKHFFNRTDYCDLTLQFQDNAQLKVHRLVLNACTEYFEILERTCEMYSDCLVMPDDLQADVVVPIINFMYTGQLEFKTDLLEKLYVTSVIMNMPVLTKLLDVHRTKPNLFGKRYSRSTELKQAGTPTNSQSKKRTFSKAFENDAQSKKKYAVSRADGHLYSNGLFNSDSSSTEKSKNVHKDPKPTRYELPAELDDDNIFDNSFTSLSYESKPLMVHPETTKYYTPKKNRIFDEPSSSKGFLSRSSSMDIVECRKITQSDIFEDVAEGSPDDSEILQHQSFKEKKDSSQLFDQILTKDSKVSIERKDNKETSHLDHAKIISEVLKKYPHLVKSNKNIKLKILNSPNNQKKSEIKPLKPKTEVPDYTYETDVVDSKEAARLIALGAENIKGPWICLICGTPGRALHFTSYYNYRRHLVEVHNEKPISNICEYCGLKSLKRNYLIHHLYTKHGVEPPRPFNFPKCNICSYVALTEAFLVKHKMSHSDNRNFRCTICAATFPSTKLLLQHIQKTGHKLSGEKKPSPQCMYCFKIFTRDVNLYAHLKSNHFESAKNDGVIDDSDDEKPYSKFNYDSSKDESTPKYIEVDIPPSFDSQNETSYHLEHRPDGNIEIITKKPRNMTSVSKKNILNAGFSKAPSSNISPKVKKLQDVVTKNEFIELPESSKKEKSIVLIDNNEFILPDTYQAETEEVIPSITTRPEYSNIHHINTEQSEMTLTKSNTINQPIQIVVSNEEEYKALLSSNHSIIFDDGATEKALTVLTAPPNSNVGDAINLNNSQSNDMMIIRENFPLNISEPNTTNNSNIVVVYSHPVNEPNKHYQLITASQGIEGQFVQSSAIFTQNYETVTTSTPIMGGHLMVNNTPIDNSWQNSVPIVTSEMQIITSDVHNNDNSHISQLPQVEITEQAVEVPVLQQLSNLQETAIASENGFANISNTLQTLTEITPTTTYQSATIIPISAIPTISSINEPMVVDSYDEVGANEIQSQADVMIEQQTVSFKQPVINIHQQSDTFIEQQSDSIIEQQPDIILEQQAKTLMKQQTDTLMEQHPDAIIEPQHQQQSETIMEQQPDIILEQQTETLMKQQTDILMEQQPVTLMEHHDTIIEPLQQQQSETIIKQQSDIILEQQAETVMKHQTDTLLEQQPVTLMEQHSDTIIEPLQQQQSETIIKRQSETIIEQQSDTMIEHHVDAVIEQQPNTIKDHHSDAVIEPQPDIIIEQHLDTVTEQQSESIIQQQPNSTIEHPDADTEKYSENVIEQQNDVSMQEPQQSAILDEQQLPEAIVGQHKSDDVFTDQQPEPTTEQQPNTIIVQQPDTVMEQHNDNLEEQPVANIIVSNNTDISIEQVIQNNTPDQESNVLQSYGVDTTSAEPNKQNEAEPKNEDIKSIHSESIVVQEQTQGQPAKTTDIAEQGINEDEETIENIARDIGVDPNILIHRENMIVSENNEINKKPAILKLVNLTSEWSEDEIEEDSSVPNEINNAADEVKSDSIMTQNDIESEPTPENKTMLAPLEKISSLLNDWEDNDSQEGSITAIPTEVIKNTIDVTNENTTKEDNPETDTQQNSITTGPKEDNIRRLVSDWDEDDEEENKV